MSNHWVLIFAYHFPPQNVIGAARPHRFYKYLQRQGYKCHVITAVDVSSRPDLDAEYVPDPFFHAPARGAGWQMERAVRRLLVPGVIGVRWAYHAYQAGLRFLDQHPNDRVTLFSTFPPLGCHLAAWGLARRKGLPWIADFRDPLVGNPIHDILPARSRLTYELVQRTLNASAGAFIANTDGAELLMKQKHRSRASRVHLIWNGFDPEQRVSALPLPGRDFRLLTHVGELYESRTAVPLLESFQRIVDSGSVPAGSLSVELTGPMEEGCLPPPAFLQAAEAQGWLKLRFNQVPKTEALEIAQRSDSLLLIQPQSAIQVPGKLFEYLQIGRPILAFVPRNSSVERVLEKSGVEYRCIYSNSSPGEFDHAVLEFLKLCSDPVRPSPWFEETFNAESQTAALARIIEQL
jgi:hypothetical protein